MAQILELQQARGLWQGAGLLLLLLAVYAGARAWLPDDVRRDDEGRIRCERCRRQ